METRRFDKGMLVGALLIGFGALFLLQTLGVVGFMWQTLWGLGFLGGAAAFFSVFANDRRNWWALFPAAGMGFVGLQILLPGGAGLGGTLFLGLMGAAFVTVHLVRRDQVWPLIPGGVLLTLASITLLETVSHRIDTGAIFFFGLALTFASVWYQALDRRFYSWALIVAGITGGIGTLVLIGTMIGMMFKVVLPVGLILLGVYALTDGRMFKR